VSNNSFSKSVKGKANNVTADNRRMGVTDVGDICELFLDRELIEGSQDSALDGREDGLRLVLRVSRFLRRWIKGIRPIDQVGNLIFNSLFNSRENIQQPLFFGRVFLEQPNTSTR